MTNILKKIFKNNSQKKVKKKPVIKKVAKSIKKKTKKVKKIVSKKIAPKSTKVKKIAAKIDKAKKVAKVTTVKEDPKVNNLRISKSNEVKPEIIKAKKQEPEKREYKIKDHVVYPKHGVG